ncbi:hypothetical protein ACFVAQ_46020 [Streptomyces sp. NPDC057651]|uniref:hypothetical protein n=1 Tax=Streptomyces sp. NPDC057651 TaxID=3346194 RepID=UPI0036B95556
MSTNDQPADDEQPRTARHRPSGPSKEPTAPAQQVADIDAMLERARLGDKRSTAQSRFTAQMLAIMDEYERETIAARALAGDPNPTDADPLEYVRDLANAYRDATRPDPRGDVDHLLDDLAAECNLTEIRALRLAGEAAVAATPRAIRAARARGTTPPQIAALLGLTPSRVYQVLREPAADGDQ